MTSFDKQSVEEMMLWLLYSFTLSPLLFLSLFETQTGLLEGKKHIEEKWAIPAKAILDQPALSIPNSWPEILKWAQWNR